MQQDIKQRFIFEDADVRGHIVRLGESWRHLLAVHRYPDDLGKILGEMLTATILLSASLKYQGSLSAQLRTKGGLIVTECTSDNTFRGMAKYDEAAELDMARLIEGGLLALTINPAQGDRYQGIVDIRSGNITQAIEDYLLRSQQIETRLWLAVTNDVTAGLLLQKMPRQKMPRHPEFILEFDPGYETGTEQSWDKFLTFTDTLQAAELLTQDFSTLLRHLYPEDNVRLFEPTPISFRCSCSSQKVKHMLRLLGNAEVSEVLAEKGLVGVNCEFCNRRYDLDRIDIGEIFATDVENQHSQHKH